MEPPVALAATPYSPSERPKHVSMKTLQVSGSWSFSGNRLVAMLSAHTHFIRDDLTVTLGEKLPEAVV